MRLVSVEGFAFHSALEEETRRDDGGDEHVPTACQLIVKP